MRHYFYRIILIAFLVCNPCIVFATIDTLSIDTVLLNKELQQPEELKYNANLDSMLNLWYVANSMQPDTSQEEVVSDSIIPTFSDSVYMERLSLIETVIPLSYNKIVRNFIELYTMKRRSSVESMIGLAEYYFPIFDNIFDYYGIPNELKYMSIIESALNPRAYSRARAVGIWQFMYGTGSVYGLTINSLVDERMDPIRSTHAAARFLKDLYRMYNDWILALAAYNCGPGNVNKAISRSGGKRNYWDLYYYLPRETRGYVPAFMAAVYFMHYYTDHQLVPKKTLLPLATDTIMVFDHLHLGQVAEVLDIPSKQLQDLNPQYRYKIIPKRVNGYTLKIPVENVSRFIDLEDSIFTYKDSVYFKNNLKVQPKSYSASRYYHEPPPANYAKLYYTVKSGDNLGYIASWYNIRVSDLRYWNNIRRNIIRSGQKLRIYVPKNKLFKYKEINSMTFAEKQKMIGKEVGTTAQKSAVAEKENGEYIYYTVNEGDTLWEIAKQYPGVTDTDIMQLNNISTPGKIKPGQRIKIKPKS